MAALAATGTPAPASAFFGWGGHSKLDRSLERALARHGVRPLRDRDFPKPSDEQVELGQMLFFDRLLSGNLDVSCATCHHPLTATADGLSLPAGVGGFGLSTARAMGPGRERVPRNAPDFFNRGHRLFTNMFWDGRIEEDDSEPSGFRSPAGAELPPGLDNALAVQAMFPVTSGDEMRGKPGENEIANASSNTQVWSRLMDRLLTIDEYRDLFAAAYPDVPESELGFQHAANAIAAFEAVAGRADRSPFDLYLRGRRGALSDRQKRGALLFYGKAGCAECHSGPLQTDLAFHATAAPQFGPGKGDGPDGNEDYGREQVSGDAADRLAFRTPSLRNVELTGPWSPVGAYGTLREAVEHHLDPLGTLEAWDRAQVLLPTAAGPEPELFDAYDDPAKRARIAAANELAPVRLTPHQVTLIVEFLRALTDPRSVDLRWLVPARVPSELPLAD